MSETELQQYLDVAVPQYAQEHVRSGRWSKREALERAQQEFDEVLTDGLNTKDQYFFSIVDEQTATRVGVLWFAIHSRKEEPSAYVYDLLIYEPYRHQGYGKQALRAIEAKAYELGLKTVALHIFGHNHAARAMYEKLGYVTTNLTMVKALNTKDD
jgi:RimJ/RimL family protein N-acetyltransferase